MTITMEQPLLAQYQAVAQMLQHIFFIDPAVSLINGFKAEALASQWPRLANSELERTSLATLTDFLQQWQGSAMEEQQLRQDFTRLFCGPGAPLAAPWGSVYLCQGELLNGASTQALQHFYQQHDIQLQQATNEPIDHLGLMFAVLAYLLQQLNQGNHAQQTPQVVADMLQQHLLPFAERVLLLTREHSHSGYYGAIAGLASVFLLTLAQHFQVIAIRRPLYR